MKFLFLFILCSVVCAESLKVGVLLPLNDKYNEYSQGIVKGIEFANKLANERVNKKSAHLTTIELKIYPHERDVSDLIRVTRKLISDNVRYIIGGQSSKSTIIIRDLLSSLDDKVFISPTATNPDVTRNHDWMFRACFTDDFVSMAIADYVASRNKISSVGVVYDLSDPYSSYLSTMFTKRLKSKYPNIEIFEKKIISKKPEFKEVINTFRQNNVKNVLLAVSYRYLLEFYSQAASYKFFPSYYGSDSWGNNKALINRIVKGHKDGDKFVGHRVLYWNKNSERREVKSFVKNFHSNYGVYPDSSNAIGYDTAMILFNAISNLKGEVTPLSVRKMIRKHPFKGGVTSDIYDFAESNSPKKNIYFFKISKKGINFSKVVK